MPVLERLELVSCPGPGLGPGLMEPGVRCTSLSREGLRVVWEGRGHEVDAAHEARDERRESMARLGCFR